MECILVRFRCGFLVYTGQPWHPQLELIARALTSHRAGQAWVMRRRTQAEMDQLVEAAGFRQITLRVDDWGIFSVSLAQRDRENVVSGKTFTVRVALGGRRVLKHKK